MRILRQDILLKLITYNGCFMITLYINSWDFIIHGNWYLMSFYGSTASQAVSPLSHPLFPAPLAAKNVNIFRYLSSSPLPFLPPPLPHGARGRVGCLVLFIFFLAFFFFEQDCCKCDVHCLYIHILFSVSIFHFFPPLAHSLLSGSLCLFLLSSPPSILLRLQLLHNFSFIYPPIYFPFVPLLLLSFSFCLFIPLSFLTRGCAPQGCYVCCPVDIVLVVVGSVFFSRYVFYGFYFIYIGLLLYKSLSGCSAVRWFPCFLIL